MRVCWLQHVSFEGLGAIEGWFRQRGIVPRRISAFEDPAYPPIHEVDWLIVMGGPMSVHDIDIHPWLKTEKAFIRRVVERETPVLGICLGAQFLAEALGGMVGPNAHREIGWWPVQREPGAESQSPGSLFPREFDAFHWHGETFDLPPGAKRLARTRACLNQAFSWGNHVVALQFHLEITPEGAEALMKNCPGDLAESEWVQPGEAIRSGSGFSKATQLMDGLLGWMSGVAQERING